MLPEWTPPSTLPAPPAPPSPPEHSHSRCSHGYTLHPSTPALGGVTGQLERQGWRESHTDRLKPPCDCPLPPETPREESDGTDTAEPTRRAAILGRGGE